MALLSCPDLQHALDGLDAVSADASPAAFATLVTGSWTLAHVLEHLGKAYGGTAYILEKAVTDGAPKGSAPRLVQRALAVPIVRGWYFPTGVKSPAVAKPEGIDGPAALALARESLVRLDAACVAALGTFGAAARVANHPLLGGFTVAQWRGFHRWHTEHHLRQIRARARAR